ncbi:metallophosphoesterase family protein [Butyrivibrio sp. NC2002]|uniref:metallophosphoesterase family protein n=1 Tax=Butyrivibrio sp. NC2002 TaxID=1410610 RepID=UPI00056676EC|nr:metallophosphoesterase family protein [Butyrivibrio sp. NC2002]
MDIAVFADIHGNHSALQACIDYCMGKGITNYILLGDYVGDCPNPQKTMELIYVLKQYFTCFIVKGHREEAFLKYKNSGEAGWNKGSGSGFLLNTYEQLKEKDLNFFDSLKIYGIHNPKNVPGFEYCHGSMESVTELLFAEKRNTRRTVGKMKTQILLHGHTHVQESFSYRNKKVVNPGSVGLPRGFHGLTQFCVLHGNSSGYEEEMIRLKYNKSEILKEFENSDFREYAPAHTALTMHTIRTGIDVSEMVLLQAMRMCEAETGIVRWPNIPEKYWAKALKDNYIDLSGKDIPRKDLSEKFGGEGVV